VELQKANLENVNLSSNPDDGSSSISSISSVAQLLAKPDSIAAVSSLYALGGLTNLLGALSGAKQFPPIQTTGVNYQKTSLKRKRSPSSEKTNADKTKIARI